MKMLFSLFLLLAALAACTPLSPPAPPGKERGAETAREKVRAELAAGQPAAALARLTREVRSGTPEKFFAGEYPQAVNGVLALAARHQQAGRFEQAGLLLRQALQAYPDDPGLQRQISRKPAEIRADLQAGADRMMEQGLAVYRQGHLEEAIAIWNRLLAVHPENQAARRAVETASTQLRNLRTLK